MSSEEDKPRPVGRPPVEIKKETFESLLEIPFATCAHIAGVFKCGESTIVRWVKENYDMNFDDLKAQRLGNIKLKLAGKQYQVAMNGNVAMLIWLGKQYLDQSDKQKVDQSLNGEGFVIQYVTEADQKDKPT